MDLSSKKLLSIHDVMPETLDRAETILRLLRAATDEKVLLLVVPGKPWLPEDIARLAELQDEGCELAGHGWSHECDPPRSLKHRIHSLLISRNVAEHLSLSPEGEAKLIDRCFAWFVEKGLTAPEWYVPPAWALGGIERTTLRSLPFRYYETLSGVYDASEDRFHRMPVVGYEADTPFRAIAVRTSNAFNKSVSAFMRRPLRVSIHPNDLELRLGEDLRRQIQLLGPSEGSKTASRPSVLSRPAGR